MSKAQVTCRGVLRCGGFSVFVLGRWWLDTSGLAKHELVLDFAGDGFFYFQRIRVRFFRGHLNRNFQFDRWSADSRARDAVRELEIEEIVSAHYATVKARDKGLMLRQSKWQNQ